MIFFITQKMVLIWLDTQINCMYQPVEDGLFILSVRRGEDLQRLVMPNPGAFRIHQLHQPHCPLQKMCLY